MSRVTAARMQRMKKSAIREVSANVSAEGRQKVTCGTCGWEELGSADPCYWLM